MSDNPRPVLLVFKPCLEGIAFRQQDGNVIRFCRKTGRPCERHEGGAPGESRTSDHKPKRISQAPG